MSEKKTVSVLNFFKRNLYYFLIGASLIIIATIIAIVLSTGNPSSGKVEESSKLPQDSASEELPSQSEPDSTPESTEKPSDKPTDSKIVFTLPVSSGSLLKNYTSSTVVFNQTLGVYTGHMGVDFGAEAGSEVLCAYEGTVESITSSYLQGTTVVVSHGNGLKTVYNSIDAEENLKEGQKVTAGEVIGFVSDNNRQEYKDGPHLHFEVLLNGERVDPNDYLMMAEK